MSRIGEWLKKAENLARGHSKQADQLLDKAERYTKERTGHKYDEQIDKGTDAVQRRYGGGEQRPDQQQEQERRRPEG
ncbi:antitoxin [Nonomuraea sp. M3C6]|uniref:Antitoxin n=1 Tax=Nonomuraea marmarensis TaxID=3351344 RepID=A0ABW7AD31_9ACTN